MVVILIFTLHMDMACNIIFTLSGTSDYYVQNIVNIRMAVCDWRREHLQPPQILGISIFSVSAKTEGSDRTVRMQSI